MIQGATTTSSGSTWNRPTARPTVQPVTVRPTGQPSTPRPVGVKIGPGGTTINDLYRVASEGIPGWRPGQPVVSTPPPLAALPQLDEAAVLSGMIGGPETGYGKKYGGYPTAGYFQSAVEGAAYNRLLAGQMAAEQAANLAAPYQQDYVRETDVTNPYSTAGKTFSANTATAKTPLGILASKMAGAIPNKQDMYAANMARMNAIRGAGDVYGETGQPLPIKEQIQQNAILSAQNLAQAQLEQGLRSSGADRYQQIADFVQGISPSDLMQQIAVQQYGYDPALAAGLFPISQDLAYQQMLNDAYNAQIMRDYGIDPNATTAEIVLRTQGPEGLATWQQQRANDALYGTPSEQRAALQDQIDAENADFDQKALTAYNFDPKKVSGADPDTVRTLLTNKAFTDALTQAERDILNGGDPLSISSNVAQQYAQSTKDIAGARILGEILASFDLSYFGQ
jgi:hypothetical protein